MKVTYNATKNRCNIRKRGIGFDHARKLLSGPHAVRADTRRDYGGHRFISYGLIRGRMYVCVYTLRGDAYRITLAEEGDGERAIAYGPFVSR
jgi:uncharacterized protein